jgi:SAM-dependent methyltransferase
MKDKSFLRSTWDLIGFPFRFILFDQAWLPRFGWTTLEEERLAVVLPKVRGRLLDIGAGPNTLVKLYGGGIGVDVFDWGGGALVVKDTARLPFSAQSFDTITLIACLNHIPNRREVLQEACRVIKPGGGLIITMINPLLGEVGHKIWWYSEDKQRGGMKEGEVGGMWSSEIIDLCLAAGFRLQQHKRFIYGLNHLYVFEADKNGPEGDLDKSQ